MANKTYLDLVRGAYFALNETDPDATTNCWLCLSTGPPYYEVITFDGNFNKTSNHASCSWGTGQKLTLTGVSRRSPGLCIGTPSPSHQHLCGQTHFVSRTDTNYYLCHLQLAGGPVLHDSPHVYQLVFLTPLVNFVSWFSYYLACIIILLPA